MDDATRILMKSIDNLNKKVDTIMVDVAEMKGEHRNRHRMSTMIGAILGSSISGFVVYFISLLPASR